ncbi:hypothetical protein EMCRGX_G018987 [Ephydatia muelleri]
MCRLQNRSVAAGLVYSSARSSYRRITKYRAKKRECKAFSAELKIAFDIDTSGDGVNIHPEMFCMHYCSRDVKAGDYHHLQEASSRIAEVGHLYLTKTSYNFLQEEHLSECTEKIRGIVNGEASALIEKEVLILSDEERRSLLDKAGISSSIELGQLRWLKSPGICLAGEERMRATLPAKLLVITSKEK